MPILNRLICETEPKGQMYGEETVNGPLDAQENLLLRGTTVLGKTSVKNGTLDALGARLQDVYLAALHPSEDLWDIHRNTSNLDRCRFSSISSEEILNLNNCEGEEKGSVKTSSLLMALDCKLFGPAHAKEAYITKCPVVTSLNVDYMSLESSTVRGDVTCGASPTIKKSVILGTLTCPTRKLEIESSKIKKLFILAAPAPSVPLSRDYIDDVIEETRKSAETDIPTNRSFIYGRNLDKSYAIKVPPLDLNRPQIVKLLKGSIIEVIEFQRGYGEVHLDEESKIGSVKGGTVIKCAKAAASIKDSSEGKREQKESNFPNKDGLSRSCEPCKTCVIL